MTNYSQPAVKLNDGTSIPLLGFGTWQIKESEVGEAIKHALEVGYRHIDTATMYENEAGIGRALQESSISRNDLYITTKLPPQNAGKETETIDASLEALQVDHVDMWLLHWPVEDGNNVPTWEKMIEARDAGKATSIGVSNLSIDEIDELIQATGVVPAMNQVKWSTAKHDADFAAKLRERGIALEGYSPLRAANLEDPKLVEIAESRGVSAADIVLAWHAAHEYIVLPKSTTPERIKSNAEATRIELTADEVAMLDNLEQID